MIGFYSARKKCSSVLYLLKNKTKQLLWLHQGAVQCSLSNKTCLICNKTLKAIVKGASKHKVKIAISVLTNLISEL